MQEVIIKGKKKICFLVKNGDAAKIVIPIDGLSGIDYSRLSELDSKGGELMKHMRDTVMDNGVNALKLYESLLIVVEKEVVDEPVKVEAVREVKKPIRRRGKAAKK